MGISLGRVSERLQSSATADVNRGLKGLCPVLPANRKGVLQEVENKHKSGIDIFGGACRILFGSCVFTPEYGIFAAVKTDK